MDRLFEFAAGAAGPWRIERIAPITGETLATAPFLAIVPIEPGSPRSPGAFTLRGARSNERYTAASERAMLIERQADLGRPEARAACLIPITKSARWWALAQDERRAILEQQSRHIGIGAEYLPAVARRLYHCRDLGEPFDFLTWFEYAPEHEGAFDELLARLRATPEWEYVEREVEVRVASGG